VAVTAPPFLARTRAPIRVPAQILPAAVLVAVLVALFLAWDRTLGWILAVTVSVFPDLAAASVQAPALAGKVDVAYSVLLAAEGFVPRALVATKTVDSVDGRQPPTLVLFLFQQPVLAVVVLVGLAAPVVPAAAAADNTDCDAVESILHRLVGGGVAAVGFALLQQDRRKHSCRYVVGLVTVLEK